VKPIAITAAILACAFASTFERAASAQLEPDEQDDPVAKVELTTADTFGRPNAWDAAKNPELTDEFNIHVHVRRLLIAADDELHPDRGGLPNGEARANASTARARAIAMLTDAIHRGAKDPRLFFDLGETLYEEDHAAAAAEILGKTLAAHPTGDGAHSAWLTYAFANSKLDRPDEERHAYEMFLANEPTPSRREIPLLNLAEANMRAHRLSEAIDGYREVEQLSATTTGSTDTGILAVWGLAIALDRQGDARGAAEQARIVSRMDPEDELRQQRPIIDSKNVYFVPAYEKFWYLALAATEDAKQTSSPAASLKAWAHAVTLWEAYVEPAQKIAHPEGWNAIALRHLAVAQKQLKAAEIAAKADAKKKKPEPEAADPFKLFFTP
jgi:tetratricopeptide (TPR) repeat protein